MKTDHFSDLELSIIAANTVDRCVELLLADKDAASLSHYRTILQRTKAEQLLRRERAAGYPL